jgi:hypothetical protein
MQTAFTDRYKRRSRIEKCSQSRTQDLLAFVKTLLPPFRQRNEKPVMTFIRSRTPVAGSTSRPDLCLGSSPHWIVG